MAGEPAWDAPSAGGLLPNSRFHGESNPSEVALHCLDFPFRLFLQVGISLLLADALWSWALAPHPALRDATLPSIPELS